jgi:hypothetical protein
VTTEQQIASRTRFERTLDRVFADLPWGVLIFGVVSIGGLVWALFGSLPPGDYLAAVGAGSGLLAIGHGIRSR